MASVFILCQMGDKVPTKVPTSEDDLEKKAKTHVKQEGLFSWEDSIFDVD